MKQEKNKLKKKITKSELSTKKQSIVLIIIPKKKRIVKKFTLVFLPGLAPPIQVGL